MGETHHEGRIDPTTRRRLLTAEWWVAPTLRLAARIGVPGNRVSMIVAGKRGVTGDTALRLAAALGTTPDFWMNLQKGYELAVARAGLDEGDLAGMRVG